MHDQILQKQIKPENGKQQKINKEKPQGYGFSETTYPAFGMLFVGCTVF